MKEKHLREKIVVLLYNASDERDNKSVGKVANEIMSLFTTELELAKIDAKIESYKAILILCNNIKYDYTISEFITRRLSELTKQKEKLKNE